MRATSTTIRIPKETIKKLRGINKTFAAISDDAELVRSALNQLINETKKEPFLPYEEYHYEGEIYGPWAMAQMAKSAEDGDEESRRLLSEIEKHGIVCGADHQPIDESAAAPS